MIRFFTLVVALLSAAAARAESLWPADLDGTWRMSAVSSNKYGCEIPGAMTIVFKADGPEQVTGTYSGPALASSFDQSFYVVATLATAAAEHVAAGGKRAITLDAPKSLRRILAVETEKGADGKPSKLEWSSTFGGFGEEPGPFDGFTPSAWLTRCP